jgi:hypothetical protein
MSEATDLLEKKLIEIRERKKKVERRLEKAIETNRMDNEILRQLINRENELELVLKQLGK